MGAVVADIRRYPVKGLGGETLDSAELDRDGMAWDRAIGLPNGRLPLQVSGHWTSFEAFRSLKTDPGLGSLSAHVEPTGAGKLDARAIVVVSPDGPVAAVPVAAGRLRLERDIASPASEGATSHAMFAADVPLWDVKEANLSIINLATVRSIQAAMAVDLDPLRFRANVYLDGLEAWAELGWVGRRLRIGQAHIEVFGSTERCKATSLRPGDTQWDLNVPGALAAHFGHLHNGVYARVTKPGRINVGDTVECYGTFDSTRLRLGTREEANRAPRSAEVRTITQATDDTWSVSLRDPYGLLGAAEAGQYVRLHRSGESPTWRNYTLSGQDGHDSRITVRCNPTGAFSPWLTTIRAGERILVSGPHGQAHIDPTSAMPLLVLTAGIGITPALRIAQSLAEARSSRPVTMVHVDRTETAVPHLDELISNTDRLANTRLHVFLTRTSTSHRRWQSGRPSTEFLCELVWQISPSTVFICGPAGFIEEVSTVLRMNGVAPQSILIDPFYSPLPTNASLRKAPYPGPFSVRWPNGHTSTWQTGNGTLLDLAETAGLAPPAGCRSGACGTCEASVRGNTFALIEPVDQPAAGRALLCTAVPTSDVEITAF